MTLVERLEAENKRLSELCDKWNSECDEYREENKRQAIRIEQLEAENAALREDAERLTVALKPFANVACIFDDGRRGASMPSSGAWQSWPRIDGDYELTVEDLRNARAAIYTARNQP